MRKAKDVQSLRLEGRVGFQQGQGILRGQTQREMPSQGRPGQTRKIFPCSYNIAWLSSCHRFLLPQKRGQDGRVEPFETIYPRDIKLTWKSLHLKQEYLNR